MDRLLKVEGAGNDFVLGVGRWADRLANDADLVTRLCHRRKGIGADGTLSVWLEPEDVVRLLYRNSDASPADFCANATRCAARVAVELLGAGSPLTMRTGWTAIKARVTGEIVTLELPPPSGPVESFTLEAGGRSWTGRLLVVGVPHLVIQADEELDRLDPDFLGPLLGHHSRFGERGMNISWVVARGQADIAIRTWELGIEGETLACGSAAVAACLLRMADGAAARLRCQTRSGDVLVVEGDAQRPLASPCRLTGPARMVAEIEPCPEVLGSRGPATPAATG